MSKDMPDQIAVRIQGSPQQNDPMWLATQAGTGSRVFGNPSLSRSYRLGAGGTRGAAGLSCEEAIPADALVEIEFENGLKFWTRGDKLRERLAPQGVTAARGSEAKDDRWTVPTIVDLHGNTRGAAGKLVIKCLRWVGLDPVKGTRDKIVEIAETRSIPREGLFRVGNDGIIGDPLIDPIPDGERTLILLHGTASTTNGSFCKLWLRQPKAWGRLRAHFGERIYALEHCTLTKSPIENALLVAQHLPKEGRLYLLSHSRGGLVGELLCLDPETVDLQGVATVLQPGKDASDAERAALEQQRTQFESLVKALRDRPKLEIARFVRVACPILGTSITGDKLDQWFSCWCWLRSPTKCGVARAAA
jgi:hypothetical protein